MTDRSRTIGAVYGSGLLQGIALILFPAAGPLLTDTAVYALSSSQYGALFTPQILAAIIASLFAARMARRVGMKNVLMAGLLADVVSMLLLGCSFLFTQSILAFGLLLLATTAVGLGFGFTITALNAYAFDLFPGRADAAVTALHVLTGLGQGGAALVLGLFVRLGFWWGAPVAVAAALALMAAFQLRLMLRLSSERTSFMGTAERKAMPGRVWIYAAVVFLYGICEGTFGNWAPIYLEQDAGLTLAQAGLGLSIFWTMVTVGRVLFALATRRFGPLGAYATAPFVIGAVFLGLPSLQGAVPNILGLAVAGLAAAFFFPLSISLASSEAPDRVSSISGIMVAAVMLGTGFSANAVGLLREMLGLSHILRLSSVYAFGMGALVIYLIVANRSRQPVMEVAA